MRVNKVRKSRDSIKKKEEHLIPRNQRMIKFNFSEENLKCFINDKHPKTDRKPGSKLHDFSLTETKKYKELREEKQALEDYRQPSAHGQRGEPFLQASNEILSKIEKNGLKFSWSEIEEVKTEGSNEQEWEEKELLNRTFSESSSSYRKNVSLASTIDRYSYFSQSFNPYPQHMMVSYRNDSFTEQAPLPTSEYIMADKIRYYDSNVFEINPITIGHDPRTTLMIKNIPNKYTIEDLSNQIDQNFMNSYDFLYLPCDIKVHLFQGKNNCNVGYGFINFVNTDYLYEFYTRFHNKKWLKFRSDKICVLTYARLQGLSSLIEHFQNSKVLNHKDKRYQPIIKCKKVESLIQQQKNEISSFSSFSA